MTCVSQLDTLAARKKMLYMATDLFKHPGQWVHTRHWLFGTGSHQMTVCSSCNGSTTILQGPRKSYHSVIWVWEGLSKLELTHVLHQDIDKSLYV